LGLQHKNKMAEIGATATARAKASGKISNPASVKTAEWLVANKIAPNAGAAWKLVNTSKSNPYSLAIKLTKQAFNEQADSGISPEDPHYKSAQTMMKESLDFLNRISERQQATATTQATTQAPVGAIKYLEANPGMRDAFKTKYGYIPEGY